MCHSIGVYEPGAGDNAKIDYLCDAEEQSLHSSVSADVDLGELAQGADRWILDLNIAAEVLPFGVAYGWADDVFIGRIPRENPAVTCQQCGSSCPDWTTLVLEKSSVVLRVEIYESEACTDHFSGTATCSGDTYTDQVNLTGSYISADDESVQGRIFGDCQSVTIVPHCNSPERLDCVESRENDACHQDCDSERVIASTACSEMGDISVQLCCLTQASLAENACRRDCGCTAPPL